MNALVLADDDGVRKKISATSAEILIACGDLLDLVILEAAKTAGCSCIMAVKGNHDYPSPFPDPILDLHLKVHTVNGVRFGGFNGSWRYKPRGHFLYEQSEVDGLMASFPPVDIFIAHNSPRGIHDREDDVHFGFDAFVKYIERAQPRLFIHGHQHIDCETHVGATRVIGIYGQKRMEI